jgi:hypothetical protein
LKGCDWNREQSIRFETTRQGTTAAQVIKPAIQVKTLSQHWGKVDKISNAARRPATMAALERHPAEKIFF